MKIKKRIRKLHIYLMLLFLLASLNMYGQQNKYYDYVKLIPHAKSFHFLNFIVIIAD